MFISRVRVRGGSGFLREENYNNNVHLQEICWLFFTFSRGNLEEYVSIHSGGNMLAARVMIWRKYSRATDCTLAAGLQQVDDYNYTLQYKI